MSIYKRPGSKVWQMRYEGPDGRYIRRSTKQTNKKDAMAVWIAVVASLENGSYVKRDKSKRVEIPPTDTAIDSYIEDRTDRGHRADSYRKLEDWKTALKSIEIPDIDLDTVDRQLGEWKKERKWKPATYNNALGQLSGFLAWCYRKGWIDRHPLRGRAERMAVSNERERYFHPHELAAMERTARALARLKKHTFRDWLRNIIVAAPYTGLRRGVLCAARCRDVRRDESGGLWLRVDKDKNGRPIERQLLGETLIVVSMRLARKRPMAYLFPGPDGLGAYKALERWLPVVVNRVGERSPE